MGEREVYIPPLPTIYALGLLLEGRILDEIYYVRSEMCALFFFCLVLVIFMR